MRRREFITLVSGAALAWPLAPHAQQSDQMRRVGVLVNAAENDRDKQFEISEFRQRLKDLGWTEGGNIRLDIRWTAGDFELAHRFAAELVSLSPDAILATNAPTLEAVRKETSTIPLVFVQVSDPIANGVVSSLAHPGGSITGFTHFEYAIGGKWLGLLKEIAPNIVKVAVIWNPKNTSVNRFFSEIKTAAPSFAIEPIAVHVQNAAEIEHAINAFAHEPNLGLIVPPDFTTVINRAPIIALAARYNLPAIYPFRLFVKDGGLLSYGVDLPEVYRQAASYVDRILRGEKPGDLPVQTPNKIELVVSLKAANAMGLTIPEEVLTIVDEAIE